jgi:hypothetical protein
LDDDVITYGLVVRGRLDDITEFVRHAESVGVQVTGFAVKLDKDDFLIGTLQKKVGK